MNGFYQSSWEWRIYSPRNYNFLCVNKRWQTWILTVTRREYDNLDTSKFIIWKNQSLKKKYRNSAIVHSKMPTISANSIASSVYNLSDGSTMLLKTFETRRDVNATGPIASWRDDPNMV